MKVLYNTAWDRAQTIYAHHPVTQTISQHDLEQWLSWAEWASDNFHRASSAVEGRNGCLSLTYRPGRGLTSRRLAVLTTIHNYDTPRRDGTTAAERLFGQQIPDLFEWILAQMDPLPLPRQARSPTVHHPFGSQSCLGLSG